MCLVQVKKCITFTAHSRVITDYKYKHSLINQKVFIFKQNKHMLIKYNHTV